MQKSDSGNMVTVTRHKMQSSTTLNRRYVRRPTKSTDVAVSIKKRAAEVATDTTPRVTAKELKEQAIKKALAEATMKSSDMDTKMNKKVKSKSSDNKIHFGFGRVMLALACAAAAVFAIVYFVNLNMPDISLRVAAMQTGINASYPGYVPRDFVASKITSEDGKVTIEFKNQATGDEFALIEEASSWDSNALLTNFVRDEYGENYTVVREQGLTIYINGSNATWVNGGVAYKIKTSAGSLTNKQIKSIAASL